MKYLFKLAASIVLIPTSLVFVTGRLVLFPLVWCLFKFGTNEVTYQSPIFKMASVQIVHKNKAVTLAFKFLGVVNTCITVPYFTCLETLTK